MRNLSFITKRMLLAIQFIADNHVKGIDSERECLIKIGMKFPGNISNIRHGTQSFTIKHITEICKHFNMDANYFFDERHTKMFKEGKVTSPLMMLKEAVQAVAEMQANIPTKPSQTTGS